MAPAGSHSLVTMATFMGILSAPVKVKSVCPSLWEVDWVFFLEHALLMSLHMLEGNAELPF